MARRAIVFNNLAQINGHTKGTFFFGGGLFFSAKKKLLSSEKKSLRKRSSNLDFSAQNLSNEPTYDVICAFITIFINFDPNPKKIVLVLSVSIASGSAVSGFYQK